MYQQQLKQTEIVEGNNFWWSKEVLATKKTSFFWSHYEKSLKNDLEICCEIVVFSIVVL